MATRYYLASPFFNDAQLQSVGRLESIFAACGVRVYSPVTANPGIKIRSAAQAESVFRDNLQGLAACSHMLACVDWLHAPGEYTARIYHAPGRKIADEVARLNLPDAGTVWEMGWFYAAEKPVVLFTTQEPHTARLNLMLTQSAAGVVCGYTPLTHWLRGGADPAALPVWKGDAA